MGWHLNLSLTYRLSLSNTGHANGIRGLYDIQQLLKCSTPVDPPEQAGVQVLQGEVWLSCHLLFHFTGLCTKDSDCQTNSH